MTERTETEQTETEQTEQMSGADTRTGNARVDGVLDSIDGLDQKPVDEHVEVFERAHEELRGALNEPQGDRSSGMSSGIPAAMRSNVRNGADTPPAG